MDVLVAIGIPLFAAVLAAIVGAVLARALAPRRDYIFAIAPPKAPEQYRQLDGEWHEYHISKDVRIADGPLWMHHLERFDIIRSSLIQGSSSNLNHPSQKLSYHLRGEIRGDVATITHICQQVAGDIGTRVYGNILGGAYLVGIVTGLDYNRDLITSPSILSRTALNETQLSQILNRQRPPFIDDTLKPTLLPDGVR